MSYLVPYIVSIVDWWVVSTLKHYLSGRNLIIELDSEYHALSSSAFTRVYEPVTHVVFNTVPKDVDLSDVNTYCINLIKSLGLEPEKSAVFLTAADVTKYIHGSKVVDSHQVEVFITIGVDWISCLDTVVNIEAGINNYMMKYGTINIAIFTDKPLNRSGLLDLFRLISEAKGSLMTLLGPTCLKSPSLGTPSDATLAASPVGNERYPGSVGRASISLLSEVLADVFRNLPLDKYVRYLLGGLSIDELRELAAEVYRSCRIPTQDDKGIESEILNELTNAFRDPNIVALIKGARFIEFVMALNALPGLRVGEYSSDSPGIIVDELIGKSLAEYINGFKGLLSYYWVERLKDAGRPPLLSTLPPITDDIVTALVGSTLSRVYDRYSRL